MPVALHMIMYPPLTNLQLPILLLSQRLHRHLHVLARHLLPYQLFETPLVAILFDNFNPVGELYGLELQVGALAGFLFLELGDLLLLAGLRVLDLGLFELGVDCSAGAKAGEFLREIFAFVLGPNQIGLFLGIADIPPEPLPNRGLD